MSLPLPIELLLLVPVTVSRTKVPGGGFLPILGVIVAIVFGLIVLGSLSNPPSNTACQSDWTKCADNAELVNNYQKWSHVKSECRTEADSRAKYKTEWPWLPFGYFSKGNEYVTSGMAVAIEPDAQFQNGFGAMVRSRVECTYDLKAQRVISVDISPR